MGARVRLWLGVIARNAPYWPVLAWTFVLWPVLPRRIFLDPSEVPEARPLEEHWEEILAELEPLLAERDAIPPFHAMDPGQERLSEAGRWRAFIFRLYGADVPGAARRCPRTAELVGAIPGLSTALFSVLEPGARLPLHGGPLKGVWRYHLPLVVPEGDCGIKVAGIERRWQPGRPLVFDDTHRHTAWNRTDEPRVVLFVDLERPMPNRWWTAANRFVMAAMSRSPRIRAAVARADNLA